MGRQRLQQKLQEQADRHGRVFPPQPPSDVHARRRVLCLRTVVGAVDVQVWYGYDPTRQGWGCPMRQRWGLLKHQRTSPALEDKVLFTVTATGTYEQAAAVVSKWGCPMDDSTVHELVQRMGQRAEAQTQARLKKPPEEITPARPPSALGVVMVDGFLVRFRGEGWGRQQTQHPHVEWHELKTGVFYCLEQASVSASGRGLLSDKVVVSWQGQAVELGERLHCEALHRGLGWARQVQALADGAAWIWNLVNERWSQAVQVLDFYHACQHLWELARALHGPEEKKVDPWGNKRRHDLRHGREGRVLKEIAGLKAPRGDKGQIVRREQNYLPARPGAWPTKESLRAAGLLGADRSNRRADGGSAVTRGRASSGRRGDCAICALWRKPAPTAIGRNSGASINGGTFQMRPGRR